MLFISKATVFAILLAFTNVFALISPSRIHTVLVTGASSGIGKSKQQIYAYIYLSPDI